MRLFVTIQMFFTALLIPAGAGFWFHNHTLLTPAWQLLIFISLVTYVVNSWLYRETMYGRAVIISAWAMQNSFAVAAASLLSAWIGYGSWWSLNSLADPLHWIVLLLCLCVATFVSMVILKVAKKGPWAGWKYIDDNL